MQCDFIKMERVLIKIYLNLEKLLLALKAPQRDATKAFTTAHPLGAQNEVDEIHINVCW